MGQSRKAGPIQLAYAFTVGRSRPVVSQQEAGPEAESADLSAFPSTNPTEMDGLRVIRQLLTFGQLVRIGCDERLLQTDCTEIGTHPWSSIARRARARGQ